MGRQCLCRFVRHKVLRPEKPIDLPIEHFFEHAGNRARRQDPVRIGPDVKLAPGRSQGGEPELQPLSPCRDALLVAIEKREVVRIVEKSGRMCLSIITIRSTR